MIDILQSSDDSIEETTSNTGKKYRLTTNACFVALFHPEIDPSNYESSSSTTTTRNCILLLCMHERSQMEQRLVTIHLKQQIELMRDTEIRRSVSAFCQVPLMLFYCCCLADDCCCTSLYNYFIIMFKFNGCSSTVSTISKK